MRGMWSVIGYTGTNTPEPSEEVFALDGDGLLWRRFNDGVWSSQVDGVDQDTSWSDLLHNPAGLTLLRRVDPGVYQVIVEAPVIQAMGRDLFTTVADAVHEWEPEDRDGWDANVYASRAPIIPIAEDQEAELQAQITEAVSERQQTEVARDMAKIALDQKTEQVHLLRYLLEEARWQRDQAEQTIEHEEAARQQAAELLEESERERELAERLMGGGFGGCPRCPQCGNDSVMGFTFRHPDGSHAHTGYVCRHWESGKPGGSGRCGWSGWAVRQGRVTNPPVDLPAITDQAKVGQVLTQQRLELELSVIQELCGRLNSLTRVEAQRVLACGAAYAGVQQSKQEVPY